MKTEKLNTVYKLWMLCWMATKWNACKSGAAMMLTLGTPPSAQNFSSQVYRHLNGMPWEEICRKRNIYRASRLPLYPATFGLDMTEGKLR